ncbi:Enoyl reductase LovC [Triangularia verruculosa]|uniref:Enoyl reductase LovC n=1 Tax=Triangularia verruculosa TaxID=2587418 RepID=A0AAN6XJ17_9PEZI|nr:Enoyl reductase LovC [Triangularia verruculosa]
MSTAIPTTQTALVGSASGDIVLSYNVPVPSLEHDMILVKTVAISVNPVDTKMIGAYVTPGSIAGCDFAGEVVATGSAVTNLFIGDRVCGAVMGMNPNHPDVGAFANYVGARADRVLRIPSSLPYHDGAALATSFMTAGLALFNSLKLPGSPLHPTANAKPVLVYGGSTATGTAALQLLRLAGFTPIATCSPRNYELVKSYGAEQVFDYRSPDCAVTIREYTNNALEYSLDCITTVESMKICYAAIGRRGGRYTALDPFPDVVANTRRVVKADWVLGPVMLGKDIGWPAPHGRPANPELSAFGVEWVRTVQSLLEQGKLRAHPTEVRRGGLEGALDGLDRIKNKKVSGVKLVYSM